MNITNARYLPPAPRAGPHVAVIIATKDVEDKEYLLLKLDIAEGYSAGFAKQREETYGNDWSYIRGFVSYKSTARYHFSKFLKAVEESNPGNFNIEDCQDELDPDDLVGLNIGVVLGAEEYINKYGKIAVKNYVAQFISVDDVKYGNFEVPKPKTLGGHYEHT